MNDNFIKTYLKIINESADNVDFKQKLLSLKFKGGVEDDTSKTIYQKKYGVLICRFISVPESNEWYGEIADKDLTITDKGNSASDLNSAVKAFIEKDDEFVNFLSDFENEYDGLMKNPLNKAENAINTMIEELSSIL